MKPFPIVASGDTLDWKNNSAAEIIDRVVKKAKSGSIIQFHTGTAHTAEALPEILEFFRKENIKCVPVGELIYYDNYTINHNGTQICKEQLTAES